MKISANLDENIRTAQIIFPISRSFDLLTRDLFLGQTRAWWIGINGMCNLELLQRLFTDLQNPLLVAAAPGEQLHQYIASHTGYSQLEFTSDWDNLTRSLLSGPSLLFIDGSDEALIIDARTYPVRGIEEPDTERATKGARDGFVETLLFNANLIRRRIRSPRLTFEIHSVGTLSRTDVALAYLNDEVNQSLLDQIQHALSNLRINNLTMGAKSLEELLLPKKWLHPLPSLQSTERPDVACSYLAEGHILLLVDNSPSVLILPGSIFQFTQNVDDYYKSPAVGTYFRLVRFLCIPASLLLMPLFLLMTTRYPDLATELGLLTSSSLSPVRLFIYVLASEFALDLFKYSSAHSSSRFSGSLSIVGGLLIGDMAVQMNWASPEVIFYAAVTLLTTLSITSIEFGEAMRLYRFFLIITTGLFGLWGMVAGLILVLLSAITTPTFAHMSYFWPLFPFNGQALKKLLLRRSTYRAQPEQIWKREGRKHRL